MSKVFSENINKTALLIKGLRENIDLVSDKGIDEKVIDVLEEENKLLEGFNRELDQLRLELRTKSRKANMQLLALKKHVKEAKKIVKTNFEHNKWKKFGIVDKR